MSALASRLSTNANILAAKNLTKLSIQHRLHEGYERRMIHLINNRITGETRMQSDNQQD